MNILGLKRAIRDFGLLLVILRAPRIIIRSFRIRLNTFYWSCFLASIGKDVKIGIGTRIHKPGKVHIGDDVVIGQYVIIGSENSSGQLYIGDNVQINRNCVIDHSGDTTIGENTLISAEAVILSHSHGYNPRSISKGIPKKIENNCWVGYRAFVGENASHLGSGVIIGAGSVVVKPCLKKDSLYAGVPAKFVKQVTVED